MIINKKMLYYGNFQAAGREFFIWLDKNKKDTFPLNGKHKK